MSEAEKKSFFAHTSSRAPGKRQIKPTAAVLDLNLPADDDDDDDEEFIAEKQENSSASSSSSDDDSSDEDEEDSDDGDDGEQESAANEADLHGDRGPLCAVCLNLRQLVADDELMQCDKCGITVHEMCYGRVIDPVAIGIDDGSSTDSSASTEPWFCEPCLHGCTEPPFCELCPNRHGAFKRSDIGGRWVHLTCAFYTNGVTFGDTDHLTAVSWQELDHRLFGRKPCSACSDKIKARTGVTVRCEVGLCKEHFHATLGLLVDHTDEDSLLQDDDNGKETAVSQHYLMCKRHSDPDDTKAMRVACSRFIAQEDRRMVLARRKILSVREERKLEEARVKYNKLHTSLIGITICWPNESFDKHDAKMRRARHLHTSSRYLNAFEEKAELADVDSQQFRQEFLHINAKSLPFLSPGFSQEFVEYVLYREHHVIPQEQRRLEEVTSAVADLKTKLNAGPASQEDIKQLEAQAAETQEDLEDSCNLLLRFYNVLQQLGVKKIRCPPQAMRSPEKSHKKKSSASPRKSHIKRPNGSVHLPVFNTCAECEKTHDQHLMTSCDTCNKHYHIGCLDPPLDRLPKRTNVGWICHQCDESDEEEEEEVEDEDASNDGPRRLRQRSDTARAKRIAEMEEQNRAYKAAIRNGKFNDGPKKQPAKKTSTTPKKSPPAKRKKLADADDDEELEF